MNRWRAEVALDDAYALAEGPVWDPPRQRLLWVDITAGTVHEGRLAGDRVVRTASHEGLDSYTGAVVCSAGGDLLVAGRRALLTIDPAGVVRPGPVVLSTEDSRLNDGACDPTGAFLVGSMALDDRTGQEVLVRVERDGAVTVLDDDLSLSNGLDWSPDGELLYSIDTIPRVVWVRPYRAGAVGPRTEFLRFTDTNPDGLCVDAEGSLWIACWGAGQVRRFSPTGELIGVVEVAAPQVTSMAFVGPGLDRLVITTARQYLGPERLARYPDSGKLFLADVGAVGRPSTPWAGFGP